MALPRVCGAGFSHSSLLKLISDLRCKGYLKGGYTPKKNQIELEQHQTVVRSTLACVILRSQRETDGVRLARCVVVSRVALLLFLLR